MIRRDQRASRAQELHALDFDLALRSRCDRDAGAGRRPDRCAGAAGAPRGRRSCRRSLSSAVASPRVHSLKSPSTTFGPSTRRSCRRCAASRSAWYAPLEDRRAEVHVVEVQRRGRRRRGPRAGSSAARTSSTTGRSCTWCTIGKRLSTTLPNSVPRRCRVGAITQPMPSAAPISSPGRRAAAPAPITSCSAMMSASMLQHRRDPLRARAAVEPAAAVDVVGGDAHAGPAGRLAHDRSLPGVSYRHVALEIGARTHVPVLRRDARLRSQPRPHRRAPASPSAPTSPS